jgi:hypothetical protein
MKKLQYLLGIALIINAYSCSSTYNAGNNAADDVYYSSKDQQAPQPASSAPANTSNDYSSNENYDQNNSGQSQQPDYAPGENYSTTEQHSDENGNTYVTNNYNGDYYDYEYSSKIRRFYEPAYGYNYYDPYYTNSYWYDYNPYSWGVSIYLGYNWWAPSAYYYNPFCYGGFSVGFGYGYGYYGGYPYYPSYPVYPYYGYYPYASPYYGYGNGYYAGNCNPYYYNSYDNNSFYYGPRGSVSSNSPRSGSQRQSSIAPLSAKYEDAIASGSVSKSQGDLIKTPSNSRDIQNSIGGKNTPSDSRVNSEIKKESSTDKPNSARQNDDVRNNSTSRPSNNSDTRTGTENQNKIQNNTGRNSTEIKNSNTDSKRGIENQNETRRNSNNQNTGDTRINNDRSNRNSNPSTNPRNTNETKTQSRTNSATDYSQPKNVRQPSNTSEPKIDRTPTLEKQHFQKQESKMEAPNRQENRTPIYQPRNEPKQYRQESAPSPQHSQPSQPSSRPSQNNSGGGRRK